MALSRFSAVENETKKSSSPWPFCLNDYDRRYQGRGKRNEASQKYDEVHQRSCKLEKKDSTFVLSDFACSSCFASETTDH